MGYLKYNHKHFTFEHCSEKQLPTYLFVERFDLYFIGSMSLMIFALGIGILGYYMLENLSLLDSFLNVWMMLGGMVPVYELHIEAGKLFAGMYALFSGLIFLDAVSLVISPFFYHLFHGFHFEEV